MQYSGVLQIERDPNESYLSFSHPPSSYMMKVYQFDRTEVPQNTLNIHFQTLHVSRAIIILSLHIDSLPAISIVSASPFYRTIPIALFPREIVEYARGIYVHARQAIQQRTIENSDGPFVL